MFTAHPTEAARRSTLVKLQRIGHQLVRAQGQDEDAQIARERIAELVDLLEAELQVLGLQTRREVFESEVPVTASTPEGRLTYTNLIADLPAADPEAPMVLVGGHIDTKLMGADFVGANDGGSSTAVLLELARGLAAGGPRSVSWRIAFFDGEEAVRTGLGRHGQHVRLAPARDRALQAW